MLIAFYDENRIVQYPSLSSYVKLQDKAMFVYLTDNDKWYRYVPPIGSNPIDSNNQGSYYQTTQMDLIPDTYKTYVLLLKG